MLGATQGAEQSTENQTGRALPLVSSCSRVAAGTEHTNRHKQGDSSVGEDMGEVLGADAARESELRPE